MADSAARLETFEHNGVAIADTFAEAFTMVGTRVIVTAATPEWAYTAGVHATGFATSVIACNAEAAIECTLEPDCTPDANFKSCGASGASPTTFSNGQPMAAHLLFP